MEPAAVDVRTLSYQDRRLLVVDDARRMAVQAASEDDNQGIGRGGAAGVAIGAGVAGAVVGAFVAVLAQQLVRTAVRQRARRRERKSYLSLSSGRRKQRTSAFQSATR